MVDAPAWKPRARASRNEARPAVAASSHQDILGYLPLVDSIARRVFGSLPPNACLELHDLAQSGLLGLVSAGRCYDARTKVPFPLYARYRIEGEILDSLRRHDMAPRRLRRWQKQLSAARHELVSDLRRDPTDEELCERLMISLAEMQSRRAALNRTCSAMPPENEGMEQSDPTAGPDDLCERRQLREMMERLIASLSPRYREVIRLHYGRRMTLKDIGTKLGVRESRVSQIHRSALQTMGSMLKESGIFSPAQL